MPGSTDGASDETDRQASAAEAPPPRPVAAPRAARILFVDDEPDLVALHERSLGRAGQTVPGRTDPHEALALFPGDPGGFDAVVTDLSMPGMSGLDLAREVLALRPGIPVLIATGYIPPPSGAACPRPLSGSHAGGRPQWMSAGASPAWPIAPRARTANHA